MNRQHGNGAGEVIAFLLILVVGGVIAFAIFDNSASGSGSGSSLIANLQPPVEVSLSSFLIFNGYYVNVRNTSTRTLTGVTVTYTGIGGNTVTQTVGTLESTEVKTIDPTDVNWQVAKFESISVSADDYYVPKKLATTSLIEQLSN